MRIIATVFILFIAFSTINGCTRGNQVNGRSLKTANRSVSMIKNRLPSEKRIEFEVSFWTLRDSIKDKKEFLDSIHGKTPEELIELGKEVFQQRKNAGYQEYSQYTSWEQMIATFSKERIDQGRHKKLNKEKGNPSVLYRL